MDLNEYQSLARKTAIYPKEAKVVYPALGLCGEAGEIAEKIKKAIRDNNGYIDGARKEQLLLEAGDILWYLANLAYDLGISLDDVAQRNIKKLQDRQERNKLNGSGDDR